MTILALPRANWGQKRGRSLPESPFFSSIALPDPRKYGKGLQSRLQEDQPLPENPEKLDQDDAEETRDGSQSLILRCSVNAPIRQLLDYLIPKNAVLPISAGCRVLAPLGNRQVVALITAVVPRSESEVDTLKQADCVLDDTPLVSVAQLDLLRWTADYYLHPPGETMVLGLSPRERRGEPPAPFGKPGLALNTRGQGLPSGALARAPKQAALLALLQTAPRTYEELDALGISRATARQLLNKNLAEKRDILEKQNWGSGEGLEPTAEQAKAIQGICETLGSFQCHVLEGITGSGKTEVYLQAIATALATGRQALVLLPEISLTPQMLQRFQRRFQAPIAVLHSGLSDAERDRNWHMARSGHAAIVLGTRSAVFVPIDSLGLIIVDEEHDVSYSQQDGLRYSARDVAVKRAQINQCPIVLGSATPSLESVANFRAGRYRKHPLTSRPGTATSPRKVLIDTRGLQLDAGLSEQLLAAMSATLHRGEQVLLFLNRRGFAPSLICQTCGWVSGCHHCDARLTVHRSPPRLCCHHCGAKQSLPRQCPDCGGNNLAAAGLGTEQTEQALQRLFSNTPIYRVDSDTMRGRSSMQTLIETVEATGSCILLGTQLLTKGHHFPKVTCVGVIDADSQLFNPDFRGEERLAQLLTQVGGRSGRAARAGEVVIQTRHPDHPVVRAVLESPWCDICDELLLQRRSQSLPPHGYLAVMRCDSRSIDQGLRFLQGCLDALTPKQASGDIRIVGPLPAAMARRAGLYRSQLLLVGSSRRELHQAATQLADCASNEKQPAGLRWFLDIDPVETV